ncbi:MAG: hypothetical protein ACP6IP_10000 [Candidatus Njordarchaeia archaeon]
MNKIRESFGVESFAAIFGAFIANIPIYIITQVDFKTMENVLKETLRDSLKEIPIVKNGTHNTFAISIINESVYSDKKEDFKGGLIYNMVLGRIENYIELKHIRILLNKFFRKKKQDTKKLSKELEDLRRKFEKIEEEIESFKTFFKVIRGTLSRIGLKKIKERFNLSNSEIKLFIELLQIKDPEVQNLIKDDLGIY